MKIHHKTAAILAAATLVVGIASSAIGQNSSPSRPAVTVGAVKASPASKLKNGKVVKVSISHFGRYTGKVAVTECSVGVLTGVNPAKACDLRKGRVAYGKITKGSGSVKYKIRVGSAFKTTMASQKCKKGGTCVITVNSVTNPVKYAGFARVTFAK